MEIYKRINDKKIEEVARKFQWKRNSKDLLSKGKLKMTVVKGKIFERKIQDDLMLMQSKSFFKVTLRKGAVIHKKGKRRVT